MSKKAKVSTAIVLLVLGLFAAYYGNKARNAQAAAVSTADSTLVDSIAVDSLVVDTLVAE